MAKPTVDSFFESATLGTLYVRGFLAVIVILILAQALYQASRMLQSFRLLNHAAKLHCAKDTVAPYDATRSPKGGSDYWR
jgi:hypothetical protein